MCSARGPIAVGRGRQTNPWAGKRRGAAFGIRARSNLSTPLKLSMNVKKSNFCSYNIDFVSTGAWFSDSNAARSFRRKEKVMRLCSSEISFFKCQINRPIPTSLVHAQFRRWSWEHKIGGIKQLRQMIILNLAALLLSIASWVITFLFHASEN